MAFGSRLRRRRATKTVTIKKRVHSGGACTTSTVESDVPATWQHKPASSWDEINGVMSETLFTFWFEPCNGALPIIKKGYVITDADANNYEVSNVVQPGGNANRLMVEARPLDWSYDG